VSKKIFEEKNIIYDRILISLLAEALFLVFTDGRKETSAMGRKWL